MLQQDKYGARMVNFVRLMDKVSKEAPAGMGWLQGMAEHFGILQQKPGLLGNPLEVNDIRTKGKFVIWPLTLFCRPKVTGMLGASLVIGFKP